MILEFQEYNNFKSIIIKKQADTSYRIWFSKNHEGYLDYEEDNNCYFSKMLYVEPEHRGKHIGEILLDFFFKMVDENEGFLDLSGFTADGNKYLKPTVEKLKLKYTNIEW